MADAAIAVANKPAWVDLASKDPAGARDFYKKLFGWDIQVNPDPQYGGYGLAKQDGKDVAGIGPTQSPDQPSAWSFYVSTDDIGALARQVEAAGGKVISQPFDVGDQGRMAVFQDPAGAFISAWESTRMVGFQTQGSNAFGWAELNARGIDNALPFYERVFGWKVKRTPVPGGPAYNEFQVDGESIAGATELNPASPAGVPSHWLVYFNVDDIDTTYRQALDLGANGVAAPQEYPGGSFAIIADPQGATFGLFEAAPNQR